MITTLEQHPLRRLLYAMVSADRAYARGRGIRFTTAMARADDELCEARAAAAPWARSSQVIGDLLHAENEGTIALLKPAMRAARVALRKKVRA